MKNSHVPKIQIILKSENSNIGYLLSKTGSSLENILDIIIFIGLIVDQISSCSAMTEDDANLFLTTFYDFKTFNHMGLDFSEPSIAKKYQLVQQISFASTDFLQENDGLFITSLASVWKQYACKKDFAALKKLYGNTYIKGSAIIGDKYIEDALKTQFAPNHPY